jgi:DnaJ-class molecular chaperone
MKNPKLCPKCNGKGEVPRKDLPPLLKGAIGIRQRDECPVCHGVGYVEGS